MLLNRFGLNGISIFSGSSIKFLKVNYVGTDVSGTTAAGNGLHGVAIVRSPGNTVGGSTAASRNVISGNATHGVELVYSGAALNRVTGNYIGTD